ncbi:purple acid phosphatase 2 isoform 2 [Corchorus olitorius]|uniref:Purple acid phosphatase 2 isoform 2 n=2 Tax=Corchorus olitorius TaxID=93759 RepID=A0A1R3JLG1_9ROSI|nr:purple acid phosphatase 2 isoform 2 [Corchorus olitorius]
MAPKIRTKLMTMKASVLYFRIEEKTVDMPLGSDVFRVPTARESRDCFMRVLGRVALVAKVMSLEAFKNPNAWAGLHELQNYMASSMLALQSSKE